MNKAKTLLVALAIATTSMLNSGCYIKRVETKEGTHAKTNVSFSVDAKLYNVKLGDKIQTVSAHKDDSFLNGDTKSNFNGAGEPGLNLSRKYSNGTDHFRWNVDTSLTLDVFGLTNSILYLVGGEPTDVKLDLMTKRVKQVSDTRDDDSASYMYTRFGTSPLVPKISTGLESRIGRFVFGANAGLTWNWFSVSSGHWRNGVSERTIHDSSSGFGNVFGGSIDYVLKDKENKTVGLRISRESYPRISFAGEKAKINVWNISVGLPLKYF